MLKFLLLQPLNAWRSLARLYKLEIIALLGLIFLFLVGKLHHLYSEWLSFAELSPFLLSILVSHLLLCFIFLNGLFILIYLIPKQQQIACFQVKPLSKNNFFETIGFSYFKYQIILISFYLLCLTPLFAIHGLAALSGLGLFVIDALMIFFGQTLFFINKKNKRIFILSNMLVLCAYLGFFIIFTWFMPFPWLWTGLLIFTAATILNCTLRRMENPNLELIFPVKQGWSKQSSLDRLDFSSIPNFLSGKIQVLFNKELLGLWRNPAYRRLKIITLILMPLFLTIISIAQLENTDMWMTILVAAVIWIHYSNYFNEKYVQAEPTWYFYTIPIRFHQLWIAKFLVEIWFIILLIGCYWIFLLLTGIDLFGQINLIGLISLFAVFVLAIMLNFQIMFYDDPRLAGYAYHLAIIFLLIMSINYHFVGPLISIVLFVFYYYKSYRFFKS